MARQASAGEQTFAAQAFAAPVIAAPAIAMTALGAALVMSPDSQPALNDSAPNVVAHQYNHGDAFLKAVKDCEVRVSTIEAYLGKKYYVDTRARVLEAAKNTAKAARAADDANAKTKAAFIMAAKAADDAKAYHLGKAAAKEAAKAAAAEKKTAVERAVAEKATAKKAAVDRAVAEKAAAAKRQAGAEAAAEKAAKGAAMAKAAAAATVRVQVQDYDHVLQTPAPLGDAEGAAFGALIGAPLGAPLGAPRGAQARRAHVRQDRGCLTL